MGTTNTYIAAVLTTPGHIVMDRLPVLRPGPGELLVRVAASGICGSDLAAYRGTHPYKTAPTVLGHEFSGTVTDLGDDVDGFTIGDLVCSAAFTHCEHCDQCLLGANNLCRNKRNLSHLGWSGSFAEYILLRPPMTHRLPPNLDPVAGALVEPLSIGHHAVALVRGHGSVAVLGGGTIGLSCAVAATRRAMGPVVCVDLGPEKGQMATTLGAHGYIDAATQDPVPATLAELGGSADVVVIAAGYPHVLEHAERIVKPGGEIVIVSYFEAPTPTDFNTLVGKEVTVRCSALSTPIDFDTVIGWLADDFDPLPLATHHFGLHDAPTAMELMKSSDTQTGKIMLHMTTDSFGLPDGWTR